MVFFELIIPLADQNLQALKTVDERVPEELLGCMCSNEK